MEVLTEVCTCDDNIDTPCPRHERENTLQDMVVKLQNENKTLRDIIFGFNNHLLKMQADCVKYLEPDNKKCGKEWFINKMLYYLDGPEQRTVQEQLPV